METIRPDGENELGWFIGWVEKGDDFLPFAYHIRANKVNLPQRVPRVKQLLIESNVMNEKPKTA
jgi:beta-lactamase class D